MSAIARIMTALAPLSLSPILLLALAEGHADFGGGEMDAVILVPWTLWSLVFGITALVLWSREWPFLRSLAGSALAGIVALLIGGLILAMTGSLGFGGM